VTIRTGAVEIEEESTVAGLVPGAYVAITVSDTGEGMSEQVRSRALEPFFTTHSDTGGSGLGLATVYGIVTGAGGAITSGVQPWAKARPSSSICRRRRNRRTPRRRGRPERTSNEQTRPWCSSPKTSRRSSR
jgi:light-regulated signal transduction histidine kinase (bacteriophytochrome)